MGSNLLEASNTAEAFAADVIAFAAAQGADSLAKLISFFHLADPDGETKVDFQLEPSGRMTLQIEVRSDEQSSLAAK